MQLFYVDNVTPTPPLRVSRITVLIADLLYCISKIKRVCGRIVAHGKK